MAGGGQTVAETTTVGVPSRGESEWLPWHFRSRQGGAWQAWHFWTAREGQMVAKIAIVGIPSRGESEWQTCRRGTAVYAGDERF